MFDEMSDILDDFAAATFVLVCSWGMITGTALLLGQMLHA